MYAVARAPHEQRLKGGETGQIDASHGRITFIGERRKQPSFFFSLPIFLSLSLSHYVKSVRKIHSRAKLTPSFDFV